MAPSRLLLPLCALLLALAVTAATASAPLYGTDEVSITGEQASSSMTRDAQISRCTYLGGALVPMVTEAVYTLVVNKIDSQGFSDIMSFMGGTSLLSSEKCTTSANSLDCIWYWDEGRYAGAANAVAFYTGNRDPRILSGAGMIGTSVENHWRVFSSTERCPCGYLQRYGAVIRDGGASPYWADTDSSSIYRYQPERTRSKYTLCAVEVGTTTTTTTTQKPTTTTTTAGPSEESSDLNIPLVVGLSVAAAVVFLVIAVILTLLCCGGCSCLAGTSKAASASSTGSESSRGSMSRSSSFNSRGGSMGSRRGSFNSRGGPMGSRGSDMSSRSRRSSCDGGRRRKVSSRRSSSRGFEDDVIPWMNDE